MCHGLLFSSGNSQWERPSAAAAAEQSSRVVIEPAPLASQPAPDVKLVNEATGGGGGGDGGGGIGDGGGGEGDTGGGDGDADGGGDIDGGGIGDGGGGDGEAASGGDGEAEADGKS